MYKKNFEVNEKQTAAFLENAVNSVKADYDVESLSELAKLYKKNVPLTLRKYVAAYLLREALKHDHTFKNAGRFEKNTRREERLERSERAERAEKPSREAKKAQKEESSVEKPVAVQEERPHHPRVEIPEDQATTIFVSIGRNRRVFPRDLVSLLINVGGLDRERIGNIKVLANYSFVQLFSDDTDKAIAALNDYEYRGRRLVVNLSRAKEDGLDDSVSEEEAEMAAEDAAAYAAAEKASTNESFGSN